MLGAENVPFFVCVDASDTPKLEIGNSETALYMNDLCSLRSGLDLIKATSLLFLHPSWPQP